MEWLLSPLFSPSSRLFYWNLIASLLILMWFSRKNPRFLETTFSSKYWFNRSTQKDYWLYLINAVLKVLLFVPLLDLSFFFATATFDFLSSSFGASLNWTKSPGALLVATVLAFFIQDLSSFLQHLAMHKVPFLWRWHRIHHEARVLTPITLFRLHPGEVALGTLRKSVIFGACTGVFVFVFGGPIDLWSFFGVNAFGFAFNLISGNIRHSHLPWSFERLEWLIVSPLQHQIHHSSREEHWGKNYGVVLSIWDGVLGSRLMSRGQTVEAVGMREEPSVLNKLLSSLQLGFIKLKNLTFARDGVLVAPTYQKEKV